MSKERIPDGMYPISDPPPDSLFVHDTRGAAEVLGLPPAQIMRLAKSGKLLFKFVRDAGKYQCRQSDIDDYKREMENRSNQQGR